MDGFNRPLRIAAFALLGLVLGCGDDVGVNRANPRLEAPLEVDFGEVQVGMVARYELEVHSTGDATVRVTQVDMDPGAVGARHRFTAPVDPFELASGSTSVLVLTFQPFSEGMSESYFDLHTDSRDAASQGFVTLRIVMRGVGVTEGLKVEPSPVDFGSVLVGTDKTMDVTITNLLSRPVPLTTKVESGGAARIIQTSGAGRFELVSALGPGGSLTGSAEPLAANASVTVQLRYVPDESSVSRPDVAVWTIANCEDVLCDWAIRLNGRGTNAGINCDPAIVDFGAIPPGRVASRDVTCTNVMTGPVAISGYELDPSTAAEYSIQPYAGTPTELAAGASLPITIQFSPTQSTYDAARPVTGALLFRAENPVGAALDPLRVEITGRAGGPAISVTPERLLFGQIAVGTTRTKRLIIANDGLDLLTVHSIEPDEAGTGAYMAQDVEVTVPPGGSSILEVSFSPSAERDYSSALILHSNDSARPTVTVSLEGEGVDLPPCVFRVVPTTVSFGLVPRTQTRTQTVRIENFGTNDCLAHDFEVNEAGGAPGNFSIANGPVAGGRFAPGEFIDVDVAFTPQTPGSHQAALEFYISDPFEANQSIPLLGVGEAGTEIACPQPVTVPVGTPVNLSAQGSVFGTSIVGYDWVAVSGPTGGLNTPGLWNPDPPTTQNVTFQPLIVGVYVLHVTVTDAEGGSAFCSTTVTAEGRGLSVTLTWDGAGDVDLHLHNGTTGLPWFNSASDCYYSNKTPIWDAASPAAYGANPELDVDNTSSNGPENITLDAVEIGRTYTIGVHNFARSAGRIATIELFCGGVSVPNATFVSRALVGGDAGNCTANDFWKVATVTFTSPNYCTITPIDSYATSQSNCNAY